MYISYAYLLLVLALGLCWILSYHIDEPQPKVSEDLAAEEVSPAAPGPDPKEIEQFFDQTIAEHMTRYQIPGATISVGKDREVFFAKGYGLANIERNIPVDAERTLFRIGSTSKLFTWTAVMQLFEQGKLDLDRDVNTFLHEFQIPATYPQPVTLRYLMTPSAGFEERGLGEKAKEAETMISLKGVISDGSKKISCY